MGNNIFQKRVQAITPKILFDERIFVYVPKADDLGSAGIAAFNVNRDEGGVTLLGDFIVSNQAIVSLNLEKYYTKQEIKDIYQRLDNMEKGNAPTDDTTKYPSSHTVRAYVTALETELEAALNIEKNARIAADIILQLNINDEASSRAGADDALRGDISNEAIARDNADNTLQGNINNEATARANADSALQRNIDAEATARANGDNSVRAAIPTKVSQLTNDADFITNTVNNLLNYYKKSETYTKAQVDELISGFSGGLKTEFVDELPNADENSWFGKSHTLYFKKVTGEAQNQYEEYICRQIVDDTITYAWEMIGTARVDLSNYYTKAETNSLLTNKQDEITNDNKLSADLLQDTSTHIVPTQNDKTNWDNKSTVSVSETGTSTTALPNYITINGDEYKVEGGAPVIDYVIGEYLTQEQLDIIRNNDAVVIRAGNYHGADTFWYYTKSYSDTSNNMTDFLRVNDRGNGLDYYILRVFSSGEVAHLYNYVNNVYCETEAYPDVQKAKALVVGGSVWNIGGDTAADVAYTSLQFPNIPTISISGDMLTIEDVPNADAYQIYAMDIYTGNEIQIGEVNANE